MRSEMKSSVVNADWGIDSEESQSDGEEVLTEKDRFFATKSVTVATS